MTDTLAAPNVWPDAVQALTLLAIDPAGLGGAAVRATPGPVREAWCEAYCACLPVDAPVRRVPASITSQRLLGGLDLAATLAAGRPVTERGLLSQGHGGVLILAMAERIQPAVTSHIVAALDTGAVQLERDGLAALMPASFSVIALDEGAGHDERTPAKLLDRLAFHLDLNGLSHRDLDEPLPNAGAIAAARSRLPDVAISDAVIEAITATALALGIASLRAVLLAVKAARAQAAWAGRSHVCEDDATLAAMLVFAPRATQVPQSPDDPGDQDQPPNPPEPQPPEPQPPEPQSPEPQSHAQPPPPENAATDETAPPPPPTATELADLLLEAVKSAIPSGLLAQLQQAGAALNRARSQGRSGVERTAARGGRPAGTRRCDPRQGARLNVIETLRAAAPWQMLRRRELAQAVSASPSAPRIEVRRADFHVNRTKQKSETATIFVVDASGSSALNRLAEAKGCVELLLADCYIRRDQVAVLAFRGSKAEILLPPTRSLVRAKRALAGLPGGGATPLATAIDAASALADSVRRRGLAPTLIVLTDGRANIARDGSQGRERAQADALLAARALRRLAITTLLIDTSPKPQAHAELLARTMAAVYLPLPYADAQRLSKAVRAVTDAS